MRIRQLGGRGGLQSLGVLISSKASYWRGGETEGVRAYGTLSKGGKGRLGEVTNVHVTLLDNKEVGKKETLKPMRRIIEKKEFVCGYHVYKFVVGCIGEEDC